uniref:Uncharacterized protein n=1 Tax=Leptobrachium leishanense TaxID=445787 RepID=A0A8C5RAQ6_9ANUR
MPPRQWNETWALDNCTNATCVGNNNVVVKRIECAPVQNVVCTNRLQPKKIYDESGCCYQKMCECVCGGWGTSHYITFDGTYYDFKGQCTYVLVQQITPLFDQFRVYIDNFSCNPDDPNCIKTLRIMYKGDTVVTSDMICCSVIVGFKLHFPKNGIIITSSGIFVIVEIPELSAYISFNILSFAIRLPFNKFQGNTEGHCGKCSNNRVDDCILPSGQLAPSCTQMAGQWAIPPTKWSTQPSTYISAIGITTYLIKITPFLSISVFKKCHAAVPPDPYYRSCIIDGCNTTEGNILCSSLESYARICATQGVCIDWRDSTNGMCLMNCSADKVYKACGAPVEPTCNSKYNEMFVHVDQKDLMEGCYCPNGTVRFNTISDKCVSICGIDLLFFPLQPGEEWDSNCQTCVCNNRTMSVQCTPKVCITPNHNCTGEGFIAVSVPDVSNPCCMVIELKSLKCTFFFYRFSASANAMQRKCACCQETKLQKVTIKLLCPSGKYVKYTYLNAVSCACVDKKCKNVNAEKAFVKFPNIPGCSTLSQK